MNANAVTGKSRKSASAADPATGRIRGRGLRRILIPYAFAAPYVLFMMAFGLFPIIYAAILSFTSMTGDTDTGLFANYLSGIRDFRFMPAVTNVGEYLLFWLPSLVILSFVVAFLLDARPGRFSTTVRVILYLPSALAGSASVMLWLFMLDPTVSPFGPLLHAFGFQSVDSVITPGHVAFIVACMGVSLGAGGWIVIIFGALQSLPDSVIEAARIDGCGAFGLVRYVKFPLVRRYAALIVILSFATGTQVFVEPQILAAANAGFVSPTWSINELSYYYAFDYGRFGVSAAISILLFLVALAVALFVLFRTNFYSIDPA